MQLTKHFSLAELTRSNTADKYKIDNTPPEHLLANLQKTANLLEVIRTLLGNKPIYVSSGYRCAQLNQLVGGSRSSSHLQGLAADFVCPGYGTAYDICLFLAKTPDLPFDQLIYEQTWVHIGLEARMRYEVLTFKQGKMWEGLVK